MLEDDEEEAEEAEEKIHRSERRRRRAPRSKKRRAGSGTDGVDLFVEGASDQQGSGRTAASAGELPPVFIYTYTIYKNVD